MNERRLLVSTLTVLAAGGLALAHDGDRKLIDKLPAYQGPGWRNAWIAPPASGNSPQGGAGTQNLVGPGTQFAHHRVTLLAWMPLSDFGLGSGSNGNSCFGYTSPSGREYALFGHSAGTAVVEVTNPGNPVIVQQIAGPSSLWRDIRTFGTHAYAISEGGGGVQVIDLAQVDSGVVTLVNTVLTGGEARTHTLAVNTDSGRLYRAGGGTNGLRIYDLNANPADPQYLGGWFDRYVHEAQIVTYPTGGPGGGPREIAICCGGLNTGYLDTGIDLVDVTNPAAPVSIGHFTYGSPGYSHQAWLSPDRTRLYQNDETDQRPYTRVFDATNINSAAPTLPYLGEFQNGVTVDHNLYTKGTLIYESNYRGGLRVFDTSSGALTPTLVAWFDTYPEDDLIGYNGLWNNYPYFPSGTVIGSDIQRGLFVWWVGDPAIGFEFPGGEPTRISPVGEAVTVRIVQATPGLLQPGSARLVWSAGGPFTQTDLVPLGGDLWSAVFPPLPCGAQVSFYLQATATNGVVWTDPPSAPAQLRDLTVSLAGATLFAADFEGSSAGFARDLAGDTATAGLWARGDPLGTTAQPEDDHTALGVNCWFTGQGAAGGAAGAADVDGGRTTLLSPLYDVTGAASPVVSYWRWYQNAGNAAVDDSFRVDVSGNGGATWFNVETLGPGHPEASGGWYRHQFAVADFVTPSTQLRVRFVAEDTGADSIVEAAVDDLAVEDLVCAGFTSFCAGDGSAAACPCGNAGASGAGCANSTGQSGLLAAGGHAGVAADTLSLAVSGLPASVPVLLFQGTQAQAGGLGAPFGDGLRCASGTVVRLSTKTTSNGAASYPRGGDPPVSVRGGVAAGSTRYYQAWYRNAAPFCTADTFNLTNGVAVLWGS